MSLYEELNARVPHNATRTSAESAMKLAEEGKAGEAGLKVLKYIADHPRGVTCFDIEEGLGMQHQTVSSRINVLRCDLAVVYSCETRLREKTNRNVEVYRLVLDKEQAMQLDPRCGRRTPRGQVKVKVWTSGGYTFLKQEDANRHAELYPQADVQEETRTALKA